MSERIDPSTDWPLVDVDAHGVVAFTQHLVRLRSVHDPPTGATEAAAAWAVAAKMREFGWDPIVIEVAPGRPNVIAYVDCGDPDGGPTLMFEGHTDVVTEGRRDGWTVDPYGGEIRAGRLYGRGAADMKGGLAACLYAVRALQVLDPFPGRIVIGALVDEEGLMLGAKHFAASSAAARVDGAIVAEPEGGEICPVAKGALRLRVDLEGAMAHGAMPGHGRNPVVAAGRFLRDLADLEAELQHRHGEHEHLGTVHLTPTVVRAGAMEELNVIPARATVGVDVRTVPGVDHGAVVDRTRRLAEAAGDSCGVRAVLQVLDDRPPVQTPADDPVVAALAAAHQAVTGRAPVFGGVPGTTDGTILTRDAGIPTVVYGPGDKWIAHQVDEYVELADLVRCTRVYAEAARRFLLGGGLH